MAKFDEPIRNLIYSSKADTEENRGHIFRHVVQLLSAPDLHCTDDERVLLLEVYDKLASHVDVATRLDSSRAVADCKAPPMAIAERLAGDVAKVAAPILKKISFDEDALLRIVSRTGKAHHLLIAERAGLTQRVWEALAEQRRASAAKTVPTNHGRADIADNKGAFGAIEESTVARRSSLVIGASNTDEPQPANPDVPDVPSDIGPRRTSLTTLAVDAATVSAPIPATVPSVTPEFDSEFSSGFGTGFASKRFSSTSQPVTTRPDEADVSDPQEGGFQWSTDRDGLVGALSPGAERAFGQPVRAMMRTHFFGRAAAAKSSPGTAALGHILTRHLPIREFAVEIEGQRGRKRTWILTAHARFDRSSGQFAGYDGKAVPKSSAANTTLDLAASERPTPTTVLEGRLFGNLFREALTPTGDVLSAATHLTARAREHDDSGAMTDLSIILEAGYRLKTMMEDLSAFQEMKSGVRLERRANFSARAAIAECLDNDADRHGGMSRFRLKDDAADAHLFFDRTLYTKTILRMFEVARSKGAYLKDPSLEVAFAGAERLEVSVPMGAIEADVKDGDILYSPDEYLEELASPVISKTGSVFTQEFGLSVMREKVRLLDGDIRLSRSGSEDCALTLVVPINN